MVVNGDSVLPDIEMMLGESDRLRLIIIVDYGGVRLTVRTFASLMSWQAIAKDGADLPRAQSHVRPATHVLAVGETFDFAFHPSEAGGYALFIESVVPRGVKRRQRIDVR